MNKARLDVVDVVKGIGILFVVYGHVNYTPLLQSLIYGFHMPLFFIVSGFLFDRSRYDGFLHFAKRRLKSLVFVYFFFYLLAVACSFLSKCLLQGCSQELLTETLDLVVQMFLAQGGSSRMVLPPFWFILSLFATELLYYPLSKLGSKLWIALIAAGMTALGWLLQADLLPFPNQLLPWNLDSSLFVMGFYACGSLFRQQILQGIRFLQNHKRKFWLCLGIILICLVVYLPMVKINGKVSIGSKHLNNGLLLYLSGLSGTAAVFAAAVLLERWKLLRYLGQNSFCVMSVHWLVKNALVTALLRTGRPVYDTTSILQTIVPFLVVCLGSLLLTEVYNRTVKKLLVS